MDTKCTAYDDWLADTVDAPVPIPSSLAEHLQSCPACAARGAAEATLTRAIGVWRAEPPQPSMTSARLAEAVLATFPTPARTSGKTPARSTKDWIALLIASAATLAAIVVGYQPDPKPVPAVVSLPLTDSVEQFLRGIEATPPVMLAAAPVTTPSLGQWSGVDVGALAPLATAVPATTEPIERPRDWNRLAAPLSSAFRFLGDALPTTDAG